MLRPTVLLAGIVLTGCGGSPSGLSPVPSPTTVPVPPTARDGWTEAEVAATFTPATPAMGGPIAVHAPGYLTREASHTGQPLYLWPQPEAYVRAIVYHDHVPGRRLARWAGGFDVAPIVGEPASVLEGAIGELRRTTGLDIGIREDAQVRVIVDPDDPYYATSDALAFARLAFRGNDITGARIVFRSPSDINRWRKDVLLHELGHVIGLGHSTDPGDIMHPGFRDQRSFSERESVAIKLMYRWRRAGNIAPDRDPGPAAAHPAITTVAVACSLSVP